MALKTIGILGPKLLDRLSQVGYTPIMNKTYEEPGYKLTTTLSDGGELMLSSTTARGTKEWTCHTDICELPPAFRKQLPADWRGFYADYPVREGARAVVAAAIEERNAAVRQVVDDERILIESACPGVTELRTAYEDSERYQEQLEDMMSDENNDGARPPRPMRARPEELATKYPRAAAYLRMESWSYGTSMSGKSGVGARAMARLLAGEDHTKVLEDANREWGEIATCACNNS